jgi:membrane protein YqaA with SNARE-associated domain
VVGYLVLFLVVFGINLLPAFGPPTWAVLVFFRLESNLAAVPLVLIGAVAAACGRLVLAYGARAFRGRLSARRIESLSAVHDAIAGSRGGALAGLALFALAPLPSAQLFVAAGLLDEPIVRLTVAFFAGRLVSYSLYVAAASAAKESLGDIFGDAFTSPLGITLQVAMLGLLVVLLKVDWARIIAKRRSAIERA